MWERDSVRRFEWPDIVVAVGTAMLVLGLAVWTVRVPSQWAPLLRYLFVLPVGLISYWFGRRLAWGMAAAGALFILFSLDGALATKGLSPRVLEAILAIGALFLAALMAARLRGQRVSSEAQRASAEAMGQGTHGGAGVLGHVGAAIGGDFDLGDTLDAILLNTRRLIPYDLAEITLWDEERQCCVTQGWGGERAYARETEGVYGPGEGYTGWIILHRRPLLIHDIQARRDVRPKVDTPEYPFRSYVGVPLQSREQFVGTLELIDYQKGVYSERDREMLRAIGGQAAVAIENAYLYAETRRRGEQQAGLARVAALASSTLDLDELLDRLMAETIQLLDAEKGALLLYDQEEEALVARYLASAGADRETVDRFKIPVHAEGFEESIFARGGSYFCNDPEHDTNVIPAYRSHIQALGVRNFAGVALRLKDRSIGELYLGDRERGFGREEVRVLKTVAGYIATAIENSRLYDETRRRASELASLADISATVSESLELERVLQTIASAVQEVVGCQMSAIFVLDEAQRVLRLVMTKGLSEEYVEKSQVLTLEQGGRAHAAATGEPLVIPDVKADEKAQAIGPLFMQEGARAFADFPLKRADRTIGMLSVAFAESHRFSEIESELLTAFADQAAIAIENARLYGRTDEGMQRQVRALSGLQRVSREINATLELDRILELVLEEAVRLSEATYGAILLRETWEGDLQLETSAGYSEAAEDGIRVVLREPAAHPILGKVLRTSQSLLIPQVSRYEPDAAAGGGQMELAPDACSVLVVPIFYAEALAGLIVLESVEDDAFSREALEFVEGLSAQAAIAIGNARRYQEQLERGDLLRRRAEQLASVLEVSRALRSDRPLEDVLEEVAYAVQETVGFNLVLISVLEGDPPHQRRVAAAGIPLFEFEQLKEVHQPWSVFEEVMGEEFRISQSFYIPAERQGRWRSQLDVYEDHTEDLERKSGQWHPQDLLLVPLVGPGGDTQGLLSVDQPRDGKVPDRSTIEALEIFAAQAALAIENARMVEALQRRAEVLALFNEISQSATAKLELRKVLNDVVETAPQLLDCDHSSIFLLDVKSGRYVPRAAHGSALEQLEMLAGTSGEGPVGRVAESGMPLVIDDAGREQDSLAGLGDEIRAWVMTPLVVGDQTGGVLCVGRREPESFTPAEVAMLSALADQVSVAVENARLYEETRRRLSDAELIQEVMLAAASTLDFDLVLERTIKALHRELGIGCLGFLLPNERGDMLVSHSSLVGFDNEMIEIPVDDAMVGQAYRTERPVRVLDLSKRPDVFQWEAESRSALALPVRIGGRVAAVLYVESPHVEAFGEDELRLFTTIAGQLGVALEGARLFEEVRTFSQEMEQRVEERTQELAEAMEELTAERDRVETLYRITSELSASLDLDHVLNQALGLVVEAVGADWASTLMLDSESGQLTLRAALGAEEGVPPGDGTTGFFKEKRVAGWVVEHRRAVLAPDIQEDSRWMEPGDEGQGRSTLSLGTTYRSALSVPLMIGDEVLGALLLLHRSTDYFNQEHLHLVEAAAVQVAHAINNAELYGVIREQAERLGSMLKAQQVEAAKSQAVLEGVADGVMVADAQGKVILFNAAAERILDWPREEALGRTTREMLGLYGGRARDWLEKVVDWAERPETYEAEEYLAGRLDLEGRVVSVHLAPVFMSHEFLGTVSVFRDVTAEVEADRAKTEFVSMVSHELRTPMTSIKGYADLLLMDAAGALEDGQRKFVSIIKNNADRLKMLVDDLLDISRIESGRLEMSPGEMRVGDVISRVIAAMEAQAEDKDLRLYARMPSDLPPVIADSDRVNQIMVNLVGNACRYTPAGGEIVVSARALGDEVQVSVRDNGIGISPEDQEKIFDRFFRAEAAMEQDVAGTGLGLYIVKSLVEVLGGQIEVESEVGEGSTFLFTLPAMRAGQADEVSGLASAKILVVEDDLDVARLIQLNLAGDGREVLVAQRGREALELAQRERPDLITLDVLLPDVDGFEVLEALKGNPATHDIPVIIVSTVSEQEKGLRLGAVDYVAKPIDEERLLNKVHHILTRRGTVLVVDDDEDTLSRIREGLRAREFDVETVAQGKQALHVAHRERPSLVLLDLDLRDIGGRDVLRQLKDDPLTRSIPVVVMAGSEDRVGQREMLSLGAARFVNKPFSVEELVEEVEMVLWHDGLEGESVESCGDGTSGS